MKLRVKHFVLLTPFLLTGCIFPKKQTQPAQVYAPAASNIPKPEPEHPELPASATTIPQQPIKSASDSTLTAKPVSRRHRQPSKSTQQAVAAAPPAPVPETPAVNAIGQLSTGGPSDLLHQVQDSIASTEHALDNIGRPLNDQEQQTAAQIHGFLKQAREAISNNDLDGAKTLASKAKVLLSELNQ
jgi:hypothetical protein